MKKIGFIDYYLDEWHANNYPAMIEEISEGEMKVAYAFGLIDPPKELGDRISNREWSEKYGVELCASIDEVVEKSDYLVVLSPDNAEMHELLSEKPLKSGKLTYIDKTFAPDKATAERIFKLADECGTPCFSTSSLRFASEWQAIDKSDLRCIYSDGPGDVGIYAIHQIEPIICMMDARPARLMFLGSAEHPSYLIEFEDGRHAQIWHRKLKGGSYRLNFVNSENRATPVKVESDYFRLFLEELVRSFRTGVVPVPHEQTVAVMACIEAAVKGMERPFEWIAL